MKRTAIWLVIVATVLLVGIELFVVVSSSVAVSAGQTPIELFLPRPTDTVAEAITSFPIILPELGYTIGRAGAGLALGLGFAVTIAYLSSLNATVRMSARLLSYSINAFPLVGFAPLIVLVFGQGSEWGMVFLAMLLSYFPIYIAIEHAIRDIPKGLLDVSKVLGIRAHQEFRLILLPEIKGAILNSLRLAVPASIVGATIGEWLGAQHGIGRLVTVSLYQFNAELLYAALLYLVVFNIIFLIILWFLEKVFVVPRT